jgi:hypothetical protein
MEQSDLKHGMMARPSHDGKLTKEYQRYFQLSSSAEDDKEGTDRPIFTSTPTGWMDEMSQEATASFRPCLTTTEKDVIAQEVSAISNRVTARIIANDDDEFQ